MKVIDEYQNRLMIADDATLGEFKQALKDQWFKEAAE